MSWIFTPVSRVVRDPHHGTNFAKQRPETNIVRENSQNVIDAAREGTKPNLVITASADGEELSADRAQYWLEGLTEHLMVMEGNNVPAGVSRLKRAGIDKQPMPYLLIEDYGTHGLKGDWYDDSGKDKKNFYHFYFHSDGISSKEDDEGGSFGLGRTVNLAASDIHAALSISRTSDSNPDFLKGVANLTSHRLNDVNYDFTSFFGKYDPTADEGLDDRDKTIIPFVAGVDEQFDRALEDFPIQRDSEGTSVVSLYASELNFNELLFRVVHSYFLPIVRENFIVTVRKGAEAYTFKDADSIREALEKNLIEVPEDEDREWNENDIRILMEMAEDLVTTSNKVIKFPAYEHIDEHGTILEKRTPGVRQDHGPWAVGTILRSICKEEQLAEIREQLGLRRTPGTQQTTEPRRAVVEFSVPVLAKPTDKNIAPKVDWSTFKVIIQRTPGDLQAGKDYFIRDTLSIAGMDEIGKHKGYRAVTFVEAGPLAKLLRSSEDPGHLEWISTQDRSKRDFEYARYTIQYVSKATNELLRLLTIPEDIPLDEEVSKDVLGYWEIEETGSSKLNPNPGPNPNPKPLPPIPRSPEFFVVNQIAGGFVVSNNPRFKNDDDTFPNIVGAVGYSVARGNSIGSWSSADFRLDQSDLVSDESGCEIVRKTDNWFEIKVTQKEFKFKLTGFDSNRDIEVEVNEKDLKSLGATDA